MNVRVIPLAGFEGERARGVVGDFGPFGIETVQFQVFKERPNIWIWKRGRWVTLQSAWLDAHTAFEKGVDLEEWTQAKLDHLREHERVERVQAQARLDFYGAED